MRSGTSSREKVYRYIQRCAERGEVPSVREICDATGLRSTSTVHAHIKRLEEDGLIIRKEGCNRNLSLPNREHYSSVPIVGRVAAGIPITAIEDIEGYVSVSEGVRRGRELFALRVKGESMIEAGILDGDIIVVNRTPAAENGEIVVAMIDDEATVKRYYKEKGHIRLQPENSEFEPIIADEVTVLGVVLTLIRNY